MSTPTTTDPVLLRIFENEVSEAMGTVQSALLRLERGEGGDDDLLEEVLRLAHNLKGSARVAGLERAGGLVHAIETRLTRWRDGGTIPEGDIDLALRAFDAFSALVGDPAGESAVAATIALQQELSPSATVTPQPCKPVLHVETGPARGAEEYLRVPRSRIDGVVDGVGEILAGSFAAQGHIKKLELALRRFVSVSLPRDAAAEIAAARGQMREAITALRPVVSGLDKQSRELVDRSRALCLVPVSGLVVHLERVVRDVARELGQRVDVLVDGDHLNMDVALVEALKGPLAHIMRNAVDHGLESADVREAAGKPGTGHIWLTLSELGDRIRIAVRDDGAGIDVAAVANRLGEAALGLGHDDLCRAVLLPGFSTRADVTEISGRGIGLGAVGKAVERLRGRVSIDSRPGIGTEVTLDLPINLSIVRGYSVAAGGMRLILPEGGIVGLGDGGDAASSLAAVLGREAAEAAGAVLQCRGVRGVVPLAVDQLHGPVEVVRRGLGDHFGRLQFIQGAALLEDGEPALIVDLDEVVATLEGHDEVSAETAVERPAGQRVLLVDDSPTLLARLQGELVQGGYEVGIACDGEHALQQLEDGEFDVVVSDVQMPNLDGFGLLERCVASHPVILVTSYPTEEGEQRARSLGAFDYISKDDRIGPAVLRALSVLLFSNREESP